METITNKKEALKAVKRDGLALQYASEELRKDPELRKLADDE